MPFMIPFKTWNRRFLCRRNRSDAGANQRQSYHSWRAQGAIKKGARKKGARKKGARKKRHELQLFNNDIAKLDGVSGTALLGKCLAAVVLYTDMPFAKGRVGHVSGQHPVHPDFDLRAQGANPEVIPLAHSKCLYFRRTPFGRMVLL